MWIITVPITRDKTRHTIMCFEDLKKANDYPDDQIVYDVHEDIHVTDLLIPSDNTLPTHYATLHRRLLNIAYEATTLGELREEAFNDFAEEDKKCVNHDAEIRRLHKIVYGLSQERQTILSENQNLREEVQNFQRMIEELREENLLLKEIEAEKDNTIKIYKNGAHKLIEIVQNLKETHGYNRITELENRIERVNGRIDALKKVFGMLLKSIDVNIFNERRKRKSEEYSTTYTKEA